MQLKLSKDERKNGWTEETLRTYIEMRETANAKVVFKENDQIVIHGLSTYDPKKGF